MFSEMKTAERELARELRRTEGAAIKEIASRIGVAKSSVSRWVRDIQLTPEQHEQLLLRNPAYNRQRSGTWIQAARRRAEREAFQKDGALRVREGDVSFIAGCMLYWAEGAKDRNQLQFANSDPNMVRFFVDFLRKHL
jgi:transcriptional regulator with XRE-family HTH domain